MIGYTGWEIPEGNVVEVADAQGNVLWSAATITFTINGATYTADRGMMWIVWAVESAHNTGGFYYDPLTDLIKSSTAQIVKDSSGRSVHPGETITPGGVYNYRS